MKKPIGAKQMVLEYAKTARKPVAPKASSGERGRPLGSVLEYYETRDPEAVARSGLSSAGMRAGAIVRGMRRSAKYSQAELAKRIGISQERISEIERGAGPQGPTFELLERIATACKMELKPLNQAQSDALRQFTMTEELLGKS
ncbi:MAG TPA: helix-turn-helix transcriptional regulator [Candidatus Cybelea sp.]|nr:helix-turn-helix transcriptional regulator [Candidatus Cybelea sp.]